MVKYVFRELLTLKNAKDADPQKIGERLQKISDTVGGHLTPDAVVEDAKNARSPLHPYFEWDDAKAAKAHRLDQARMLIRAIKIEDVDEEAKPAFISISEKSGTSYRSFADVQKSAELQDIVLRAAQRDLEAFEKRYRELQDVCELIREARSIVERKRQRKESRQAATA